MKRIGIFGGSFNPVHVGHLSLARQLLRLARLDEVWLMVSPQNPLKRSADLLDDEKRREMVRLAVANEAGLVACDYEMNLPKPSYTWHTLQSLQQDFPDCRFVLLIGGDNWALFSHWYHAEDILEHYDVVVYPRRGSNIDTRSLPPSVTVVNAELLDLSSTDVRRRIACGESIEGMVPPEI